MIFRGFFHHCWSQTFYSHHDAELSVQQLKPPLQILLLLPADTIRKPINKQEFAEDYRIHGRKTQLYFSKLTHFLWKKWKICSAFQNKHDQFSLKSWKKSFSFQQVLIYFLSEQLQNPDDPAQNRPSNDNTISITLRQEHLPIPRSQKSKK